MSLNWMQLNQKKIQQHLINLLLKNQEVIQPNWILLQDSKNRQATKNPNEAHSYKNHLNYQSTADYILDTLNSIQIFILIV